METHYKSFRAKNFGKNQDSTQREKSKQFFKLLGMGSTFLLLFLISSSVQAQTTYPQIHKNWAMIYESPTQFEVSVRFIQCDQNSDIQAYVELFNEGTSAQDLHFNLTLTDPASGENVVQEISETLDLGALASPSCVNGNFSNLKIAIPSAWDPLTIEAVVTLIP